MTTLLEAACAEKDPICLFEGCQEFANMFVVGLLDHPMVNPPSVFVRYARSARKYNQILSRTLRGHSQQALSTQCISSERLHVHFVHLCTREKWKWTFWIIENQMDLIMEGSTFPLTQKKLFCRAVPDGCLSAGQLISLAASRGNRSNNRRVIFRQRFQWIYI